MDKQNVVYTYNGILFSFKKEILTYPTTLLNLEDIMLSGINQSQKDKYCMIPPGTLSNQNQRDKK